MFPSLDNLILLGAALVIFYVLWRGTRGSWPVRIVAGPTQVKIERGVAGAQQATIVQFLREDVQLAHDITILASKSRNGQLRLRIQGPIDDGLRQRIRNFLITVL